MRNKQYIIALGVFFFVLACHFPTSFTSQTPVCTPPGCANGEIFFCDGDCPGGCGMQCVTPTAQLTPFTPTDTPFPLCTPPACSEDEVYYCEGECPGGCGTTCATPTPTHTPEPVEQEPSLPPTSTPTAEVITVPTIISFTADQGSFLQGEDLTVTWVASGGTSANIQWLGTNGTMESVNNLPPDGNTITIHPQNLPIMLNVSNNAGTTSRNLEVTIQCIHAWVPEMQPSSASACPDAAEYGWAAQQPFEHGFMIWLQPSQTIYVFFTSYGGTSYRSYEDTFTDGDPESDPNLTPPSGLLQPIRGFGKVWRQNEELRTNLGWATAGESGFETWRQTYQGMGMHNIMIWIKDINQNILELDPSASVWSIY